MRASDVARLRWEAGRGRARPGSRRRSPRGLTAQAL